MQAAPTGWYAGTETAMTRDDVMAVLDRARWAPSGDNTQPWRFAVAAADHAIVYAHDTRHHCVYDLDGRPSQMSVGALIETAALAAAQRGLAMAATRREGGDDEHPVFDLRFSSGRESDPLAQAIESRSVQRLPYATTALTPEQKATLEAAVGPQHVVRWIEGSGRAAMAVLMFRSAHLRLTTPEAWRVHREIIDWGCRTSEDKVPDQALGVDPLLRMTMRFVLGSWGRVQFFNRYLAGTWLPRIMMDWLPARRCAAHFVIEALQPPLGIDANIAAGRAMQRFWLAATRLGLALQPEMTPLIFARYAAEGRRFTVVPGAGETAAAVGAKLVHLAGPRAVSHGVFVGRIGHGPAVKARSVRKPLSALLTEVS